MAIKCIQDDINKHRMRFYKGVYMYVMIHMGKTRGCLKDQIVGMIHMIATGDITNKHYITGEIYTLC